MSLLDEVLENQRMILKEIGRELAVDKADLSYPDTYYRDYSYNLYEEMAEKHIQEYGGGSGGELKAKEAVPATEDKKGSPYRPAKMASIRSSSAMTFNLLGNHEIVMKENNALGYAPGKYAITYEKNEGMYTIKSNNKQQPANLDAFLVSENGKELVFCEMKMTEWFSKNKSELKEAYDREENYCYGADVKKFMQLKELIKKKFEEDSKSKTPGTFEYYDVWQMFKHTLAIHNYMSVVGWNTVEKVTLLNVVYEPEADIFDSDKSREQYYTQKECEHSGFNVFKTLLENAGIIGNNFSVQYMSAKDFMKMFEYSEDKKKYLRRYE